MLQCAEINRILMQAARMDRKYDLFGASSHRYILNPPLEAAYVRSIQEQYGFILPDDYFRFITEIGNGGAGPDYGIYPFQKFLKPRFPQYAKENKQARFDIAKPFKPRLMMADDLPNYAFSKEAYDREPEKFFVHEKFYEDNGELGQSSDGFFVIGTHGCQWDFGIITAGERRGQVFDSDDQGGYILLANSFTEFYQQWLDSLSDVKQFKLQIKNARTLYSNRKRKLTITDAFDAIFDLNR